VTKQSQDRHSLRLRDDANMLNKNLKLKIINFNTSVVPTWCPGCGNYLILANIINALKQHNYQKHNTVIVYDIGCAGNMADFIDTYGIHSLHGRCIPTAVGVKLANPKLNVLAIGGDGGIYGEGLNHLIASARSNYPIKVIVSNNFLYSLTTGQASPATPKGTITKSTPQGTIGEPINPEKLLKAVNPSVFVKSLKASDIPTLKTSLDTLFKTQGFGLLDIQFNCLSFGKSR